MSQLLILYATSYGQTEKIVRRIAALMAGLGQDVTVVDAAEAPRNLFPGRYDGVLVAGSVLFGRHQRHLRRLVRRHAAALNALPSAFLSVCGAAGTPEARTYELGFLRRTGFAPKLVKTVGGAVRYTRYGLVTRLVIKLISSRTGRPTDTSRDWEFTNWTEVERFTREFAELLPGSRAPRRVTEPQEGGRPPIPVLLRG